MVFGQLTRFVYSNQKAYDYINQHRWGTSLGAQIELYIGACLWLDSLALKDNAQ